MPFYEYECSSCKFYTEVMQKVSDAPLSKCPSCGKKTMKKLISAPVFRLKGGGWYETDFKSDAEKKRNLAETADAKDEADKGDKKEAATDTKPEAKPEKAEKPVESKAKAKPPAKAKKKKAKR